MTPEQDTRDKVIRLEEQVAHLTAAVDKMAAQVADLHGLIQQAKGARWAFIVVWVVAGSAATYGAKLLGLLR